MTWQAIARKDVRDSVRSKWLWGLSVFFVTLLAGGAYLLGNLNAGSKQALSSDFLFRSQALIAGQQVTFTGLVGQLIALVAFVLAYQSIVGERDSGTIKLLLSLPHSRRDAVLGKLLGRSGVVALPVLTGFFLGGFVYLVMGVQLKPAHYFGTALLAVLLGAVFVSIAVGISAGTDSGRRSMIGVVSLYLLFTLFWGTFKQGMLRLGIQALEQAPGVAPPGTGTIVKVSLLTKFLNPLRAFETLTLSLYAQNTVMARLALTKPQLRLATAQYFKGGVPFYLTDWFMALVLVFWLVVPLAVGYLVFRDADL